MHKCALQVEKCVFVFACCLLIGAFRCLLSSAVICFAACFGRLNVLVAFALVSSSLHGEQACECEKKIVHRNQWDAKLM